MISIEEVDLFFSIFAIIFAVLMLGTFTWAVFREKHRRLLAIIAGICAGCLLGIMVFALASPYLFS